MGWVEETREPGEGGASKSASSGTDPGPGPGPGREGPTSVPPDSSRIPHGAPPHPHLGQLLGVNHLNEAGILPGPQGVVGILGRSGLDTGGPEGPVSTPASSPRIPRAAAGLCHTVCPGPSTCPPTVALASPVLARTWGALLCLSHPPETCSWGTFWAPWPTQSITHPAGRSWPFPVQPWESLPGEGGVGGGESCSL